jgi:hypothetical protein
MDSATEKIRIGDVICPVTTRKLLTARYQQPLRQYAVTGFATAMKRMKLALKTAAHTVAMEFVTEKIHLRHALKTAA